MVPTLTSSDCRRATALGADPVSPAFFSTIEEGPVPWDARGHDLAEDLEQALTGVAIGRRGCA